MPLAALKPLPKPPVPLSAKRLSALVEELAAETQIEAARLHLQQFLARNDEDHDQYAAIVDGVVNDLVGLLAAGTPIEVDGLIESLLAFERGDQAQRREIENQATRAFREVSLRRPDAMPLMNEMLRAIVARIDRLAELHRDARWRLMKARSEYQPSRGRGPINGTATDADEYLKTIS